MNLYVYILKNKVKLNLKFELLNECYHEYNNMDLYSSIQKNPAKACLCLEMYLNINEISMQLHLSI